MKKAIVAKKLGMTQVFVNNGQLVPVTVLEAGPCVVVQKKTVENDGYSAVQVGFDDIKLKHVNKPSKGHFDKSTVAPKKILKELKLEDADKYEVGNEIKADMFQAGDKVDISGVSKGKGTLGAVARWGQRTGPNTHGSKYHRGAGSMGAGTTPGKAKKNKHMAGRKGHVNVTSLNQEIIRADAEKNVILVKGQVPGPKGTIVVIRDSVKVK